MLKTYVQYISCYFYFYFIFSRSVRETSRFRNEPMLLCSHSPNDVPPEPQWNVSIAAVRGAVRLFKKRADVSRPSIYMNQVIKVFTFSYDRQLRHYLQCLFAVFHSTVYAFRRFNISAKFHRRQLSLSFASQSSHVTIR